MRTENTAKLTRGGSLSFYVDGRPAPQGSKKYMGHRGGKPILLESSKSLKEWREKIAWHARQARNNVAHRGVVENWPVGVQLDFYFRRPKSAPRFRRSPIVRPDVDKLTRAVLDALTGVVFKDDSQVVGLHATKSYLDDDSTTEGVRIAVWEGEWP